MKTLMKTRLIVFFLVLFLPRVVKAQTPLDSLILTESQNDRWFLALKEKTASEQLSSIRHRILMDTNVYIRQGYPDRIKIDVERDRGMRADGFCKPMLVFNQQYAVYIGNKTTSKSVLELSRLLTDDRIANVSIIRDANSAAIYGTRGSCGVIVFMTRNRKTLKQIKSIDFGYGF